MIFVLLEVIKFLNMLYANIRKNMSQNVLRRSIRCPQMVLNATNES